MAIPDYESLMLPLLKIAGDQKEHSINAAVEILAKQFNLSSDERAQLLPSGRQRVLDNRTGWARTYMKKAGLLTSPKRAFFQITDRGASVLKENLPSIDAKYLSKFPEFVEFKSVRSGSWIPVIERDDIIFGTPYTPEEDIESAYQQIRDALADELLNKIKNSPPEFFEQLVVDLLIAMGYGGSKKEAGKAIGRSGDEGIDGIINEDSLGLDVIYIQAKRWNSSVGRPEIQKFAGALQGHRAKKGVFITTSSFTQEAIEFSSKVDSKIALIDGERLSELMIDHNLGVSKQAVYEIKRIDSDYFLED